MGTGFTQSFLVKDEGRDLVVTFALSITTCADLWLRLEKQFIGTPYQTYSFCRSWLETKARRKPVPCAVLVSDNLGVPLLFLPLAIERRRKFCIANFMGGTHMNFGAPMFRSGLKLSPRAMQEIFSRLAEMAGINIYFLDKIPSLWCGETNPLSLLPSRTAYDKAYFHPLQHDAAATLKSMRSASHRKQLRAKLRKLMETGPTEISEAQHPGERGRALEIFFKQKSHWCRSEGKRDVFETKDTQAFIRALLLTPGAVRIFTLYYKNEIHAVFLGLQRLDQFCGWASSYRSDALTAYSPGDILLQHVINVLCHEGVKHFDLGSGDAAYKKRWLHHDLQLTVSIFGFGNKGRFFAKLFMAVYLVKYVIKKLPFTRPLRKLVIAFRP